MWNEAQYSVQGRVIDEDTGLPLAGLHVRAYDRDLLWDDCLGTAETDANGEFRIRFFSYDFKEPFEGKPEIYVVVYGLDMSQLHFTEPVRAAADRVPLRVEIPIRTNRAPAEPPVASFLTIPIRPVTAG